MAEIRAVADRLPTEPGAASPRSCRRRTSRTAGRPTTSPRWSSASPSSIADPRTVVQHLPEVRPTAWGSVPRIWEKTEGRARGAGVTDGGPSGGGPGRDPEKLGLDQCAWLVVGAAPTRGRCSSTSPRWGCRSASCGGCPRRPRAPSIPRTASRSARAGRRSRASSEAGRRRRAAGAGRDRDDRLPQRPGEPPRRSTTTAGCVPGTWPRSTTTAT